jgi:predicted  nucleic acid-binding Zn-ribbon protein
MENLTNNISNVKSQGLQKFDDAKTQGQEVFNKYSTEAKKKVEDAKKQFEDIKKKAKEAKEKIEDLKARAKGFTIPRLTPKPDFPIKDIPTPAEYKKGLDTDSSKAFIKNAQAAKDKFSATYDKAKSDAQNAKSKIDNTSSEATQTFNKFKR